MSRNFSIMLLAASALLAACSHSPPAHNEPFAASPKQDGALPANHVRIQDEAGSAVVQKVEFRTGVSSATVERMAREAGCTTGVGAGLVTEPGPVEVYRVQCDNGSTFLARCEMRQCRPLR